MQVVNCPKTTNGGLRDVSYDVIVERHKLKSEHSHCAHCRLRVV